MDFDTLRTFRELTKDLNMTKTAARLFISQQTLSNQIIRLEKELGVKLFDRKPKLKLTYAGAKVLDFAKQVSFDERKLNELLQDVEGDNVGTISFGASALRSSGCLPEVLPVFSEKFPRVNFDLTTDTTNNLRRMLEEGDLDLAICVMEEPIPKNLVAQHILADQLYLCVSEKLLNRVYGKKEAEILKEKSKLGAHVGDFRKLPFFMMKNQNKLAFAISKCFTEAGFVPDVYLASMLTRITVPICSAALAATIITKMNIQMNLEKMQGDVNVFPLLYKNKPVYHNLYLVHRKDKHMTAYLAYFMEILEDYFFRLNKMDMTSVVNSGR